jgi:hypothetical protein
MPMDELRLAISTELVRMTPAELLGAATGIVGALLLAWRGRLAAWAWVLWIVSSFAWIFYAINVWSIPMLTQQAVFAAINILGVYRWLIRKDR